MKGRARAASSSGEIRSLPIRSGRSWRKLRPTKRRFSLSNATLTASRTHGAIGRSCATVASMPINPSLTAGWASSAFVMKGPSEAAPTPLALGFRMPAEWEPHEATWLAWPHELADWPGKFEAIPWVYAEIVRHLHASERIHLLVKDDSEAQARDVLTRAHVDLAGLTFEQVPTDRVWTRDYLSLFVRDREGELVLLE